jgi:hypothetical protein
MQTIVSAAVPRRWRRTGALLLVLLTVAAPGTAAADAELDALKREAQELVDRLREELDAVQTERRRLEAERRGIEVPARAPAAPEAPAAAPAEAAAPTAAEASAETERKVSVLTEEVARLKENLALPEGKEFTSYYGLGPAASKVYQVNRGLSLGGYGEANYSHKVTDTDDNFDSADFLRFVLYTGYKFTDRLLLNAELELEHATTSSTVTSGNGSFSLEQAYLDYLPWSFLNARAGLVLVPLGFLNEIHEPTFFHGNNRPEVERLIIPTTWRELGVGVFGSIVEDLAYRTYLTTSLNAEGFNADGIRGGRQQGNRTVAEDGAWSARLDYAPHQLPGLLVGASTFLGNTGQDQSFAGQDVDAFLSLWDVHGQYRYRGLELRSLAAFGSLDDAGTLSVANDSTVPDRFDGWYAEIAYDVMPHLLGDTTTQYLAPFFRYEHYDTQASVAEGFVRDLTKAVDLYTVGMSYKPHPQVVLKFDYRNFEPRRGDHPDDVNFGLGFIF